jgi:DNA replication and repair protein RecF
LNLKTLTLNNFRNYKKEKLIPLNGLNILYGKNAQGKTNIVEAIYYLSTGKSFRTTRDTQLIMFNSEYAYIKAEFMTKAGKNSEEAMIKDDGAKSFKINSMPVKKLGHLFGNFSCIAFTPEDIKAIKETPSLRRKLIDVEISKIKPSYFFELKEYYKTLAEKNALLKSKIGEEQKRLISVYNEQLAKNAKVIISLRDIFIKELENDFKEIYWFLSGNKKNAELKYKPCVSLNNIEENFLEKLNSNLQREINYKQSFIGPHKEDMVFYLDEKEVKSFCSQGQQRTIMLAYKLSVMNIIKKRTDESPVLILDDVFSELDFDRQKSLTKFLSSSQVFITTAVPINVKESHKAFIISEGRVKEKQ